MSAVLDVVVGASAVIVASGATAAFAVIVRMARSQRQLLEDWCGEPSRPGVPERPGVMVRLERIEQAQIDARDVQSEHGRQIEQIWHEVHPNSGMSMRDQVTRIEAATAGHPGAPSPT